MPNRATFMLWMLAASTASAQKGSPRLEQDPADGKPIVVHVVVALCDNVHQGIVPVPAKLGDGGDAENNLYWGAQFGVRAYLTKARGWKPLSSSPPTRDGILERRVWSAEIPRRGRISKVYLVADAWKGELIHAAVDHFLEMANGSDPEQVVFEEAGATRTLLAGGASELVVFVGHDGLMDFATAAPSPNTPATVPSSVVLACLSRRYFGPLLRQSGAHPILLTTGLMAPEAYTLDAVVRTWVSGRTAEEIGTAARAYDQHQHCGLKGARRLFAAFE